MFGGPDGMRRLMSQDQLKPQKLSETMARFGKYFAPFWPGLVVVAVLIVVSTWTQVTSPTSSARWSTAARGREQLWRRRPPRPTSRTPDSSCWLAADRPRWALPALDAKRGAGRAFLSPPAMPA
jgi:hypothetical protein